MKWRSLVESIPGTETRSLREQFAERKEMIAKYVPEAVQAVHARVIAGLKAGKLAERSLGIGAAMSGWELEDQNSNMFSSAAALATGPLVMCFFRGRWDPFCCGQMEAMNEVADEIRKGAGRLVALSPQTVHQAFLMADQHKLRFPLLRDAGNQVARGFGLNYRVPEEQLAIYRRSFINLPFVNGEASWELPIPATFVIRQDGAIAYAFADEDPSVRPEPHAIVAALGSAG
jgi:peroxiredoxin